MNYPIETERLSRWFGKTEALHELSLRVPTGAVYALLGPNGAGKTTTIKLLMNLLRPSSGAASLLQTDSRKLGPKTLESVGYVSENQELPGWMTLSELLDYSRGFYSSWDNELCQRLLALLDLPRGRKIAGYSRGMRMKAALCVSLAYRPKLLVLDEPFGGLDPLVRDEMVDAMLEIACRGDQTIFVSSHDLSEIENLADHVGFLRDGRLIASESMDHLTARFRQVDIPLAADATPVKQPAEWLSIQRSHDRIRFIHPRWNAAAESEVRALFPAESKLETEPLSLRRIFVALAKQTNGRPS